MDTKNIIILISFLVFAIVIILNVWLTKRAPADKRVHWFIGCSIVTIFFIGILQGPIAICASLGLLSLFKKEDDTPFHDVCFGFLRILGSGIGLIFYCLYTLLVIGAIYWLWLAIQLKSFAMFFIGLFPLAFIITAPTGAYALLFGTPEWVISWFS